MQRMREKSATQFARAEHYLRRGRVTSHNSITFSSVAPIFFSRPKIEEGVGVPLTDKTPKEKKETEETCMRELKKSLPYDIACQPFDITPSQQSKVGQKLRRWNIGPKDYSPKRPQRSALFHFRKTTHCDEQKVFKDLNSLGRHARVRKNFTASCQMYEEIKR